MLYYKTSCFVSALSRIWFTFNSAFYVRENLQFIGLPEKPKYYKDNDPFQIYDRKWFLKNFRHITCRFKHWCRRNILLEHWTCLKERSCMSGDLLYGSMMCRTFISENWATNIAVRAGELSAQPLMNFLGVDSLLRISLCYYNTANEIDVLMEGILNFIKSDN